jgi:hypothetical protein
LSALRLELSPSPRLALLIVLLHGAAGGAAFVATGGLTGIALGAALVALGLAAAWSRALHRAAASVRALDLEGEGALVTLADGRQLAARVGPGRFVSRLAVALPLGRPFGRTIFVTPDMLDVKSFRALRLWALWGKLPSVATKQLPA